MQLLVEVLTFLQLLNSVIWVIFKQNFNQNFACFVPRTGKKRNDSSSSDSGGNSTTEKKQRKTTSEMRNVIDLTSARLEE